MEISSNSMYINPFLTPNRFSSCWILRRSTFRWKCEISNFSIRFMENFWGNSMETRKRWVASWGGWEIRIRKTRERKVLFNHKKNHKNWNFSLRGHCFSFGEFSILVCQLDLEILRSEIRCVCYIVCAWQNLNLLGDDGEGLETVVGHSLSVPFFDLKTRQCHSVRSEEKKDSGKK